MALSLSKPLSAVLQMCPISKVASADVLLHPLPRASNTLNLWMPHDYHCTHISDYKLIILHAQKPSPSEFVSETLLTTHLGRSSKAFHRHSKLVSPKVQESLSVSTHLGRFSNAFTCHPELFSDPTHLGRSSDAASRPPGQQTKEISLNASALYPYNHR